MIGIFGGTFDPIHYGHLRPALELLQDLSFDEVRWVPARQPPHRAAPFASVEERLQMVHAAVDGVPGFRVDERELQREGPSYTVDTLADLRQELGETPLCLLMGMDALAGFASWHRWRQILELAHLVIAHRPGASVPVEGEVAEAIGPRRIEDAAQLKLRAAGLVLFHPVTQIDISATRIRAMIAAGKSSRFLVPEEVRELIETHGLYGGKSGLQARNAKLNP